LVISWSLLDGLWTAGVKLGDVFECSAYALDFQPFVFRFLSLGR
jgi:hypothetical protein